MKLALRRADEVATYVFDEGRHRRRRRHRRRGRAPDRRGGHYRQVLCVTHLPQIAAFADHHFHVEKTELRRPHRDAGRAAHHRRAQGRAAVMLGGHATARARAHAAELLADASRPKARA